MKGLEEFEIFGEDKLAPPPGQPQGQVPPQYVPQQYPQQMPQRQVPQPGVPVKTTLSRLSDNIIWVIFLTLFLYILVGAFVREPITSILYSFASSPEMYFILMLYTSVIGDILLLLVVMLIVRKDRFILRSFMPKGTCRNFPILVPEDYYIIPNNNTPKMLLTGLLLGFLTNFACILCALIHGDIKLYFDCSVSQIPLFLFALVSVFIQSTGEELWCRGFLYERLNIHYPLWVAILVNGVLFGCLHLLNPSVGVIPITSIIVCGISYSLVRWYTGSIWICMGLHTMWNFTQNFLFGLPNSGLVSQMSVFHLDAATGISNLIYDFGFGVEGAIPAVLVDALLGIVVIYMAKRDGRLGELLLSHEKREALKAAQSGATYA